MSDWYWKDGTLASVPYGHPEWFSRMLAIDEKLRDKDYKIIKQETLPNGRFISTVWIGLDYSVHGLYPLIFETMVFESKDTLGSDLDMDRYSTEEAAREGHERIKKIWSQTPCI